jgi:hypothetical protein
MQKIKFITLVIASSLLFTSPHALSSEEDPSQTCKSAAELFAEGDIDGALEEARWCVTQLEQLKQNQTASFFKDEIYGFKAGKVQQEQAMGFSVINCTYSKKGSVIEVSLSGGSSEVANNAFAALAQFGMQSSGAGKKVRIQKRTAMVSNDDGAQVVVTLKSGGMLTFESNDTSVDEVLAFAKKIPVADLDNARN